MSNKLDMEDIRERVANGGAFLDVKMEDWFNVVDLVRLDLASGCECVLGQLVNSVAVGDYYTVTEGSFGGRPDESVLGFQLSHQEATELGLHVHPVEGSYGSSVTRPEWEALTEEWRTLIEKRRAEAGTLA